MNKIFTKINNGVVLKKIIFVFFVCVIFFGANSAHAASLSKANSNLGLVGYWPFSEGSGTLTGDASGTGNTGTLTSMSSPSTSTSGWSSGRFGKGLVFDGSDDNVNLGSSLLSTSSGTAALTVSAWVNTSYTAGYQSIFSQAIAGNAGRFTVYVVLSTGLVTYEKGGVVVLTSTKAVNDGKWHLVTATRNTSSTITLYIDGVSQGTATDSVSFSSTNTIVGKDHNPNPFNGKIDEVRIYNRDLSATEVSTLYTIGGSTKKTITNNGLVAYWPFNDGYNTEAPVVGDFSGNGNTATGVSFSGTGISTSGSIKGKLGKAVMFDGANDHFIVNDSSSLNLMSTSTTTFATWIYMTAYPEVGSSWIHQIIGDETASCGSAIWRIGSQGSSSFNKRIGINFRTPTDHDTQNNTDLPLNTWTHIAVTTDGTNARFYINGLLDTTQAYTFTPQSTSCEWGIGWNSGVGRYFEGAIDDLRLYNRTLSADEIFALSKLGAVTRRPPNNLGLVGYWPLNEGTGTSAGDASGNGSAGTLTSMASPATSVSGWGVGKFAKGLNFDGTNDLVSISSISSLNITGNVSVSGWVKFGAVGVDQKLFRLENGTSGGYQLGVFSNNKAEFEVKNSSNTSTDLRSVGGGTTLTTGRWYHLVGVYSDTADYVALYLNGVLDRELTTTVVMSTTTGNAYLGHDQANVLYLNGALDDVRVYNRTLTGAEVWALYNYGR